MKRPTETIAAAVILWVLATGWPTPWISAPLALGEDLRLRSESGAAGASSPIRKRYFNRLLDRSSREPTSDAPSETQTDPKPARDTDTHVPPLKPETATKPLEPASGKPDPAPSSVEAGRPAPALEELEDGVPARPPAEPSELVDRDPQPSVKTVPSSPPGGEHEADGTAPSSPFLPDEEVSAGARRVVEALGARLQGRSTANFDPDLTFGPDAEARLTVPFRDPRTSLLDTFVRTDRREGPTSGSRTVSGLLAFAEASGRRVLMSFEADFIQDGDEIWIRRLSLDEPD